MECKGKKFLKVVGILLIVFGGLGIIGAITSFGAIEVADGLNDLVGGSVSTGALWAAAIISLVNAILMLVAGILGIVNKEKPEKAKLLMIFGIALIVLQVVSMIMSIVISEFTASSVLSLLVGLVLPVLFIIGAKKNMAK